MLTTLRRRVKTVDFSALSEFSGGTGDADGVVNSGNQRPARHRLAEMGSRIQLRGMERYR